MLLWRLFCTFLLLVLIVTGGSPTHGQAAQAPSTLLRDPEVVFEDTDDNTTTPKELFVDCPAGKIAIAGGVGIKAHVPSTVHLTHSEPAGEAWHVRAEGDPTVGWNMRGWAICVIVGPVK
jgi:hypothetical protein